MSVTLHCAMSRLRKRRHFMATAAKPASPNFGSGPCKKRPGWSVDALQDGALGRSHRSALGKAKLAECIGTYDHEQKTVFF